MNKENKVVFISLIVLILNTNLNNMTIIERIMESERLEKIEAEKYTEQVTPTINTQLQYILMSDSHASNVILLNYHNNNHSSQGFSYKYITYLTEKFRDDVNMNEEEFKELSYINYGEEFMKIHNLKYLRADSIETMQYSFPKLYRKLKTCNAYGAAFYPIEGIDEPVGMIIILFDSKPKYDLGYYMKTISPRIQRLAILLDYNRFKKKMEG